MVSTWINLVAVITTRFTFRSGDTAVPPAYFVADTFAELSSLGAESDIAYAKDTDLLYVFNIAWDSVILSLSSAALLASGNVFSSTNNEFQEILKVDKGIKFPATQVASSDANTQDDYEEGTWTPADGSGAGLTITIGNAVYIKIGKFVFISCFITYPPQANGAAAKITGLPFTVSANQSATTQGYGATGIGQQWVIQPSGVIMDVYNYAGAAITNAGLSNQAIVLAGCYTAGA